MDQDITSVRKDRSFKIYSLFNNIGLIGLAQLSE